MTTIGISEAAWRRRREVDAWWQAYADAQRSGADMSAWLEVHPYPGGPEVAANVRRQLDPAVP